MKDFRLLGMMAQGAIPHLERARDDYKRQLAALSHSAANGPAGDKLREAIKRAEEAIAQYRLVP